MSYLSRGVILLMGLWMLAGSARAQNVAYGDWQVHLAAQHPLQLADVGNQLYVATEQAFYLLDKKLHTTTQLSRRDGLNDVGVRALAYDSLAKQLVVVYESNNIDVIRSTGEIRNISDVARKTIQGDRSINQLSVVGDRAYMATSFGLVVINLTKLEVADTYTNIGAGGGQVSVFSTAITHDTIYASTSAGLLRGRLSSSVNLLDYRSWTAMTPPGSGGRLLLNVYNNRVYAAETGSGGLYALFPRQNTWRYIQSVSGVRQLRPTATGLLVLDDSGPVRQVAYLANNTFAETVIAPRTILGASQTDGVRQADGSYYIADYTKGVLHIVPGPTPVVDAYQPNSPGERQSYSVLTDASSGIVDVFVGEYSDRYLPSGTPAGFYEFKQGQWTNYIRRNYPTATDLPQIRDFVRGARTPDGTLYIASYGDGLVKWQGPGSYEVYSGDAPGTPLRNVLPNVATCYIADLAVDVNGKIWLTNRHFQENTSGLFQLDPITTPPTWTTTPFIEGMQILDRLALDDNGYVWVSIARKTDGSHASPGVVAVDPSGTQTPRYFSTSDGLPSNEIYDLAKDQSGDIWAATLLGVAVLNGPSGAFYSETLFRTPIVRKGEGTGYPALWNTAVRTLAVDGANRKWFGTDEGLWLFSADGDEALLHFTTENSPLPSNRIVDVSVDNKTGDVWIVTDMGVVAYRGSATITEGKPSCTTVAPNPVRPEFSGTVGIAGLANNALVKITDVAGHLVYATTATGGTVTWNLNDPNGQRVRSGVYLVLSSDADGKNTCVSKVAVLSK